LVSILTSRVRELLLPRAKTFLIVFGKGRGRLVGSAAYALRRLIFIAFNIFDSATSLTDRCHSKTNGVHFETLFVWPCLFGLPTKI